jgi:hypothetical protein
MNESMKLLFVGGQNDGGYVNGKKNGIFVLLDLMWFRCKKYKK